MTEPLYGLQIYTVREALAEDFKGTLQRLHDLGIRHLEVFRGMPLPPEEAAGLDFEIAPRSLRGPRSWILCVSR